MKIEFLHANAVNTVLLNLMEDHNEFHWAVAWGSMTDAAKCLLKHPAKIKNVTFGVAFSHTDPALLDNLVGIGGARAATKFAGGTYHPKVYCFRTNTTAAAIVGSANFTFGGLEKNHEAAVLIQGDANEPFFVELLKFTKASAAFGEPITAEFAATYRASYNRASRMPKPARDPMDGLSNVKPAALSSPMITMSWPDYVRALEGAKYHDIDDSLAVLRIAQKWFASVSSFANLELGQRQAIAGLVIDKSQRSAPDLGRDWGWFGSMRGMGDFAKLVIANDRHIARAIDCIPQKGEVTRQHFDKYVKHFERAFENSDRTGGYATASRLLAMKRPDTFLCICNPNITEASARMGFSRTTLSLTDYWEKVVSIIRLADWYNADKPDNASGAIWESRAAMLDAILYRP